MNIIIKRLLANMQILILIAVVLSIPFLTEWPDHYQFIGMALCGIWIKLVEIEKKLK